MGTANHRLGQKSESSRRDSTRVRPEGEFRNSGIPARSSSPDFFRQVQTPKNQGRKLE